MNYKNEQQDLIIVYSGSKAKSAQDQGYTGKGPFSRGSCRIYNKSYSYFLKKCKKLGIKAAFTSSKDIIGPGVFQSYWTYDGSWFRHKKKACSKIIFDKFTPSSEKEKEQFKLMVSDRSIITFNNKIINKMFTNKLCTYKQFKEFAIPSVEIDNFSKQDILFAKKKLKRLLNNHDSNIDFNSKLILKDITGGGGYRIHKISSEKTCKEIIKHYRTDKKEKISLRYILQPFIDCTNGFIFRKHTGMIDLRLIILNNKIIQTYIRIAKKDNFRCNAHQGGDLIYIEKKEIPPEVIKISKKIIHKLSQKVDLEHSLYALDFIKSNEGTIFFIEGNTNPGINWYNKTDEIKSKELINHIVNELKLIIHEMA